MAKHFTLDITDTSFRFARKDAEIAAEEAPDGIYVVRTSLPAERLGDTDTVRSYKSLALVERAFRCIKTVDLQVRPVHHWRASADSARRIRHGEARLYLSPERLQRSSARRRQAMLGATTADRRAYAAASCRLASVREQAFDMTDVLWPAVPKARRLRCSMCCRGPPLAERH